jgi:hypothetical protein
MLTRREVLLGGLLTLIYVRGSDCCAQTRQRRTRGPGCVLTEIQANQFFPADGEQQMFITGQEPMIPKSGDRNFDIALAQTLAKIAATLDVLPHFAYYDDFDGRNAYATSAVRGRRSDGTVLFGQRLLSELMGMGQSPAAAVTAVCAHEFGHILQFKRGLSRIVLEGQSTVKRAELQADYFAGYFAGRRKIEKPDYPAAVVAATQYNFGDNDTESQHHHGTNRERGSAVVAGFKAAYNSRLNLGDAIQSSISYVRTL